MSNTSIGLATKGSKLAIKRLSLKGNTHVINEILDDDLTKGQGRVERGSFTLTLSQNRA